MATLEGKTPAQVYKDLLQVSNENTGITTLETVVEDGEGTASIMKLSTTSVDFDTSGTNTFKLGGVSITSTAEEINFVDGVTSNVQTQIDSKMSSLGTVEDSFVVGGSGGTTVNKTVAQVKTILDVVGVAGYEVGSGSGDIPEWGKAVSGDGFATLDDGKLDKRTVSQAKTDLQLGSGNNVTFNQVSGTTSMSTPKITTTSKTGLVSTPVTHLQYLQEADIPASTKANEGRFFYWVQVVSATSHKRHLSLIMQDGPAVGDYTRVDLHTKEWNPVAS